MKAAIVHSFDNPPHYGEFADPIAQDGESLVTVRAAALSPLVKGQASGRHYSGKGLLPVIPGVDGVGTLPDGRRVYFAFPKSPYGAMAEQTAVRPALTVSVPDGLATETAAAIANPGMSSWAALTARAHLVRGERVLIQGATGTAGRLAVQIAKHLGAGHVIATGRDTARLNALKALGADQIISLDQSDDALAREFRQALQDGIDVVLDYLWGKPAELLLAAASGSGSGSAAPRIRYVQIGSAAGPTLTLPASLLRSSGLELLGSGLGSNSHETLIAAIGELLQAVGPAHLKIELETAPLSDVEAAWTRDTEERRLVITC